MVTPRRPPTMKRKPRKIVKRRPQGGAVLNDLIKKLKLYKDIRNSVKAATVELDELRLNIRDVVSSHYDGAVKFVDDEGIHHSVTIVTPTQVLLDIEGLQGALTEDQWDMCHEWVFSEERLEDLIARGEIHRDVVAPYVQEVDSASYPKIT